MDNKEKIMYLHRKEKVNDMMINVYILDFR